MTPAPPDPDHLLELGARSIEIRRSILEMAHRSRSAHVGSALSIVDLLTVLYFSVLRLDEPARRDIFVLSKAHAAMALYATLARRGLLDSRLLVGYHRDLGTLPAHLDRNPELGIEASTGSLGHGFGLALGMAVAFAKRGEDRNVYTLLGDGECQEGAIWEGAMFAPRLGVENLTALVDVNRLQGYGRPDEICQFEPFARKWRAFGWEALEVNGHDHGEILDALHHPTSGRPRVIVARTVKGRGVSFMEDRLIWHYYQVTDEHLEQARAELREQELELEAQSGRPEGSPA